MDATIVYPEHGYLELADISGYDHAQEIIADLLQLSVQIEGDAVFAYMPEKKMGRGETLFELIEVCYQLQNPRLRWIARPFYRLVSGFPGLELRRLKRLLAS